MNLKDPKVRQYIYTIFATLVPVLMMYGFVTADEGGKWLAVVAAVLNIGGFGMAAVNTKK